MQASNCPIIFVFKVANCSFKPSSASVWNVGCLARTMSTFWAIYAFAALCVIVSIILMVKCVNFKSRAQQIKLFLYAFSALATARLRKLDVTGMFKLISNEL